MKLYYHKTDGGAEYYCLKSVKEFYGTHGGENEGAMPTAIIRTDGNEIEIVSRNVKRYDVKLSINLED